MCIEFCIESCLAGWMNVFAINWWNCSMWSQSWRHHHSGWGTASQRFVWIVIQRWIALWHFDSLLGHVQFRIGVCAVPVSTSARTEHHVATIHCAFVHFLQVNCTIVNFQCSFVTESLVASCTQNTLLSIWSNQCSSKTWGGIPLPFYRVVWFSDVFELSIRENRVGWDRWILGRIINCTDGLIVLWWEYR